MSIRHPLARRAIGALTSVLTLAALSACSMPKMSDWSLRDWMPSNAEGSPRKEMVLALTDTLELIRFNAGQPSRILSRVAVTGLPAGDTLIGIDYRVARGVLYTLSNRGQLYTLDADTGVLTPVGTTLAPLQGQLFGFDFNPAADRIRVVSDTGQNLRLHPDTGALASTDPNLKYSWQSKAPRVAAAGYTYNKDNDKLTTNYAIDLNGTLLTQGTVEGVQPAVSPNTGQLRDVGALGLGPLEDASMDITDTDNTALAALRVHGKTALYLVNLQTAQSRSLGLVDGGQAVRGLAIIP